MTKLIITMAVDNAAFKPSQGLEVGRILRSIATDLEDDDTFLKTLDVTLYDVNGNCIGDVIMSGDYAQERHDMSNPTEFADFELGDVFEATRIGKAVVAMRVDDDLALLLDGVCQGQTVEVTELSGIAFLLDREDVIRAILDSI